MAANVVLIFDLLPNTSFMAAIKNGPGVPKIPPNIPPTKFTMGFALTGIEKPGDQIVHMAKTIIKNAKMQIIEGDEKLERKKVPSARPGIPKSTILR